jgi:hypothetical protein
MASKGVHAEMPGWFQEVWTEVREMKANMSQIPQLKEAVVAVEGQVKDAVGRIKHLETNAEEVNNRLQNVEEQKTREASSAQARPSIVELMTREETRLERLIVEAGSLAGTVIIGKQPSAWPEKYSEDAVKSLVARISGSATVITPRGSTGVFAVSFKKVAPVPRNIKPRSSCRSFPHLRCRNWYGLNSTVQRN